MDHDDDPYCISKGLFYAHIGWLMFKLKPLPSFDNVADLKKDSLLVWQDRHIHLIAVLVAFVLPASIGFLWGGWKAALGAFLIGGVLRVVVLQHATFCINSLCHYIGAQPYSSRCSARDSWILAILTFGEGYHNYQHDYRNGVKPWQIDLRFRVRTLTGPAIQNKGMALFPKRIDGRYAILSRYDDENLSSLPEILLRQRQKYQSAAEDYCGSQY